MLAEREVGSRQRPSISSESHLVVKEKKSDYYFSLVDITIPVPSHRRRH